MENLSNWFHCPKCNESNNLSVKQVIGLGNFSVNIDCGMCGFRHVERDPDSDNWNKRIDVKQSILGRKIRYPKSSRTLSNSCSCPKCGSKNVESWVYSENSGLDSGNIEGHVRLNCKDCNASLITSVSHN